jgi:hypothetical protein
MKPLLLTIAILAALPGTVAAQDTTYFSYAGQPTILQLASYYQIMVHTDSGWTFAHHWMNDRLKVTGRISDDMKRRLGTFTYYDTAGMVAPSKPTIIQTAR